VHIRNTRNGRIRWGIATLLGSCLASASPTLTIETPYHAGESPPGRKEGNGRRSKYAEWERWNGGGFGSDRSWHPQPRVVVSEPAVIAGKVDVPATVRTMRANLYGAIRRCYDEALRAAPDLEGRTVVRIAAASDGTIVSARPIDGGVVDTRKYGKSMPDKTVRACLGKAVRQAHLPAPRTSTATMNVAIDLWPGDTPLPETAAPRSGRMDVPYITEQLESQREAITSCYEDASRRQPGLWGRMVVRVDVDAAGRVVEVKEAESTFPDREVVRCIAATLRELPWGELKGGDARLLVPLRWGQPSS